MCECRRLHAEGAKQRDVLGGIGKMILTANHVRNAHLNVIHHIHEMEHRLAVRAHNHEIRLLLFAIGQLANHLAANEIRNSDRLTLHAKPNGALVFVCQPLFLQFGHATRVNLRTLRLIVRTAFAHAVASRIIARRALVPIQPQPAQALEDHIDRLGRVALLVRILNA